MNLGREIKTRIAGVNKSILEYRALHNSIFNDNGTVITQVSLNLGLPYYIEHALTGKILTMSNNKNNTLTLENKPTALNPLKKSQEWNIISVPESTTSSTNTMYKISSNTTVDNNNKCLSYDNAGSTHPKILNFQTTTSIWKITENNAYKTIGVGLNTARVLDVSDNLLELNNLDLGDATRTLSINRIDTQSWIIMPSPLAFFKKRDAIYLEMNELKNLVKKTLPTKVNNNEAIASNVFKINETIIELEKAITALDLKTTQINMNNPEYDPEILEGNYQHTTLYTTSTFYTYVAYILFSLFIIASLIYIYINPDETSLDMFMVALSIFILLYYIYDYFNSKQTRFTIKK